MTDDRFHFVALGKALHKANVCGKRLGIKMPRDGDDGRGAIEGPDLAFEIILRRIHHGDMLSGVKAQYLGMLRIIARKRQRELFLDLIGQNLIKEKLRERHGNPYLRAEGLWSTYGHFRFGCPTPLKRGSATDQHPKAPPIERPNG